MAAPNQHGLYPTVPHSGRDMAISNGSAEGINEAQVDLLVSVILRSFFLDNYEIDDET